MQSSPKNDWTQNTVIQNQVGYRRTYIRPLYLQGHICLHTLFLLLHILFINRVAEIFQLHRHLLAPKQRGQNKARISWPPMPNLIGPKLGLGPLASDIFTWTSPLLFCLLLPSYHHSPFSFRVLGKPLRKPKEKQRAGCWLPVVRGASLCMQNARRRLAAYQ
jgi:hypothetical protein